MQYSSQPNKFNQHRNVISDLRTREKNSNKSLILVASILLITFVTIKLLNIGSQKIEQTVSEKESQVISTLEPTNLQPSTVLVKLTPTVLPISGPTDQKPIKNTIYYQTSDNTIFYTNDGFNTVLDETGNQLTDEFIGILGAGDYKTIPSSDYRKLQNPIRIYTFSEYDFADQLFFADHIVTDDNKTLFISLISAINQNKETKIVNLLFAIDIKQNTAQVVWQREIDDQTYPDFFGAISITTVLDKYIEADLAKCYSCEEQSQTSKLVINYTTGKDLFLGVAKDLLFDLNLRKVNYVIDQAAQSSNLP